MSCSVGFFYLARGGRRHGVCHSLISFQGLAFWIGGVCVLVCVVVAEKGRK